ncbi:MAG: hypothetical protein ACE5ID_01455 [Acidobacteriota bacterium]
MFNHRTTITRSICVLGLISVPAAALSFAAPGDRGRSHHQKNTVRRLLRAPAQPPAPLLPAPSPDKQPFSVFRHAPVTGPYDAIKLALPQVDKPFAGDPGLEPIPSEPLWLLNVDVFANGKILSMRFPPRVNGQTQSDGDRHADLFVLFDEATGLPIDQPFIIEAVAKNSALGQDVSDLNARMFSAIWEIHAVTVASWYDPRDPALLIDSTCKLFTSTAVREIFQTNMFLNCPIVPWGSVVDPGSPPLEDAFFQGRLVKLAPYDMEDGGFNPQIMFKFEDEDGNTQEGIKPGIPHLVASFEPGDPFYTSIWEIWTVHVPNGFDVTTLRSKQDVKDSGFPITSSGIRLNCPVVKIDGDPFPFEDAFAMLQNDHGRFNPNNFRIDIPPSTFLPSRTFLITEINQGGVLGGLDAAVCDPTTVASFPRIDPSGKGNVIPLILQDPFQTFSSGPNTTGPFLRIHQADLDAAFVSNNPPRLPEPFEANIAALVSAQIMEPEWLPGGRPYAERLALLGRALHELVWAPEHGGNQKDVTSCIACHSTSAAGGGSRGLYTLERATERPDFGPPDLTVRLNAGSMWGSGASEQLVNEIRAAGGTVTNAHGSVGQIGSIRAVISGARNAHFGIQSTEFILGRPQSGAATLAQAALIDLDGDGVINESTVGEVTAETVFLMTLPVPKEASSDKVLRILGAGRASIARGKSLFRRSISNGGLGCASCHKVFHPLASTEFRLTNPETDSVLTLPLSHHTADMDDVQDGLAAYVGQPGIRNYGDFRIHKMGPLMHSAGQFGTEMIKTAELWDCGSVFPYLRDGSMGADLNSLIRAHRGLPLDPFWDILIQRGTQFDPPFRSTQRVTIWNMGPNPIQATAAEPIRVMLARHSQFIRPTNADEVLAGGSKDGVGAVWLIKTPIPAGGAASVLLEFSNVLGMALDYDLVVEDYAGFSEAAATAFAFQNSLFDQENIIDFLRAQLIGGKVGEGSGGEPPPGQTVE